MERKGLLPFFFQKKILFWTVPLRPKGLSTYCSGQRRVVTGIPRDGGRKYFGHATTPSVSTVSRRSRGRDRDRDRVRYRLLHVLDERGAFPPVGGRPSDGGRESGRPTTTRGEGGYGRYLVGLSAFEETDGSYWNWGTSDWRRIQKLGRIEHTFRWAPKQSGGHSILD